MSDHHSTPVVSSPPSTDGIPRCSECCREFTGAHQYFTSRGARICRDGAACAGRAAERQRAMAAAGQGGGR